MSDENREIPADPTPAAPPVTTVTLTSVEAERLYAAVRALDDFKAEKTKAEEAAKRADAIRLAKEGEYKQALDLMAADSATKLQALRDRLVETETASVVSNALAGIDWLDGPRADQARRLLALDIEASIDESGTVAVYDRQTKRPAADVLAERAKSDAFAHFRKPSTKGGTITPGSAQGGPGGPPPLHKQLGDRLAAKYGAKG